MQEKLFKQFDWWLAVIADPSIETTIYDDCIFPFGIAAIKIMKAIDLLREQDTIAAKAEIKAIQVQVFERIVSCTDLLSRFDPENSFPGWSAVHTPDAVRNGVALEMITQLDTLLLFLEGKALLGNAFSKNWGGFYEAAFWQFF